MNKSSDRVARVHAELVMWDNSRMCRIAFQMQDAISACTSPVLNACILPAASAEISMPAESRALQTGILMVYACCII